MWRLHGNWKGDLNTVSLSWVWNAAIFIHFHIRRQSTAWYYCGWQKRKHGATLFPAGLFNYRRSESAFLSGCTMTNNPELVSDTTGDTLFCLVNRIFAQPCACVAIRDDPRVADARESMHIAVFQPRAWLAIWNFIYFSYMHLLLVAVLCSNFAINKKMMKNIWKQIYWWKILMVSVKDNS